MFVNKLFLIVFLSVLGAAYCSSPAHARSSNNENQQLIRAVESFLYQQASTATTEVMIAVTPPTASFGVCINPEPFFPNANQRAIGRVSVGVRCGEAGEQVRYVQAQVSVLGSYVVAAADLPSGAILSASNLRMEQGDIAQQRQATFSSIESLAGMVVRRNLRAGQVIHEQMVQVPQIIGRGDNVAIIVEGSGFSIQREGTAIDAGGMHEEIRVRISNREVVTGRVAAPGKVVLIP